MKPRQTAPPRSRAEKSNTPPVPPHNAKGRPRFRKRPFMLPGGSAKAAHYVRFSSSAFWIMESAVMIDLELVWKPRW